MFQKTKVTNLNCKNSFIRANLYNISFNILSILQFGKNRNFRFYYYFILMIKKSVI